MNDRDIMDIGPTHIRIKVQRLKNEDEGLNEEQRSLLNRDYNMPTGEDKTDKSVLPAVLQKRAGNFGKKGNSKWTHLTD